MIRRLPPKQKITPGFKPPKPKPPTPTKKAKIMGKGKDKKKFDPFETILHADAGSEGSGLGSETLDEEIEKLTKGQIDKLERKIIGVRNRTLAIEEESNAHNHSLAVLTAIERRKRKAIQKEAALTLEVETRLNTLQIEEVYYSDQKRVEKIKVKGEILSTSRFIRKYLQNEKTKIQQMKNDRSLLRWRQNESAEAIIERMIRGIFSSR